MLKRRSNSSHVRLSICPLGARFLPCKPSPWYDRRRFAGWRWVCWPIIADLAWSPLPIILTGWCLYHEHPMGFTRVFPRLDRNNNPYRKYSLGDSKFLDIRKKYDARKKIFKQAWHSEGYCHSYTEKSVTAVTHFNIDEFRIINQLLLNGLESHPAAIV